MNPRNLGSTEIQISPIIMGTWQAGKAMWTGIDDAETKRAIRAAFDSGITTFDTAEVYGNGHSERIVGEALADVRDKVVFATKVFSNHLQYNQVTQACHRSLKNLGTDYIDLYQIHWPAGAFGHKAVPMEETMNALLELKKQGKIRAIGVSNFSRSEMETASQFGRLESLQPPYSLFWRTAEKENIPYCVDNGMTVLAYSSMAQGMLTGKFQPGHQFKKGDHRSANILFKGEHFQRASEALEKLRPIADKYALTLGQLALAWVIAQPNTCAIAGARNSEQSIQNAAAGAVALSGEDLTQMNAISKTVTDHLDDNPVMWKW